MKIFKMQRAAGVLSAFLFCVAVPAFARAEVDCSRLAHERTMSNGMRLNQVHVFCGERRNNRLKGFHSRPGGRNPATVERFEEKERPNAAGIYTGTWSSHGSEKFSSMFPDSCTYEQVLNSISHASAHPERCPSGAPPWAHCGRNRPEPVGAADRTDYCGRNGARFFIAFAPPEGGLVNTAFPLR